MKIKIFLLIFMVMAFMMTACIKETYDMNKLSERVHLSPTWAISAINGDISLRDIVKPSDTVVYNDDNFVRLIFKKDSIINLQMADFYDLGDMVSYSEAKTMGEMSISPFFETINFIPVSSIEITFPLISTFENAVFSSGTIDISIKNTLAASLSGIKIQLYNSVGHTPIGNQATISVIPPGETGTATINLSSATIMRNSIIAALDIAGYPVTFTPIEADISGSNLKVKSGRIIIPQQAIESLDNNDTITFDPGNDIELDEFKIKTGRLSYKVKSTFPLGASVRITMPTALRGGVVLKDSIIAPANTTISDSILMNNTIMDMGTDPVQPYNRIPLEYSILVNSGGSMVDFNSEDSIRLDFELLNPDFDYAKGYFGQQTESIDQDSIDLEIEDILSHVTGDFLISSPSIKLNYSNSFAIPIEINLNAIGKKSIETVNLGLAPFIVAYPVAPANRDISATLPIDKSNSHLPQLISMPPERINFSGSAKMNPSGNNDLRDNCIFGNSRFLGDLEIEVPLEFRLNNLQFKDTVDNFLKDDDGSNASPIKPEDFKLLRVDIVAKNGFPLGVSLSMSLYDSTSHTIKSTVDATGLLDPAPVNNNGKASGSTETTTQIEFTRDFFSSITEADKIIFQFTLNTTGNGSSDVKIYSDYRIDFTAALVVKPDINLK